MKAPLNSFFNIQYLVVVVGLIVVLKGIFTIIIPGIILNLFSVVILFVIIHASFYQQKVTAPKKTIILLFLAVIAISIYHFTSDSYRFYPKLFFISFSQIIFPLMMLYVFFCLNQDQLNYVFIFFRRLVIILCFFSVVEILIIPKTFMASIANLVLSSKIGDSVTLASYKDSLLGFEWTRSGSLVFDPLIFGMISVIMLIVDFNSFKSVFKKSRIALIFGVLLSGIKSVFIVVFFSLYSRVLKKYSIIVTVIVVVILMVYLIQGPAIVGDMLNAERLPGLHSISNHMIGLLLGMYNTLESPFFGNGPGTSGFLVYFEVVRNNIPNIFRDDGGIGVGLGNGNESALAVITYQMGFPFLILLVYSIYKAFLFFYKRKIYHISGLIAGLWFFLLLSESGLGFAIQFIAFLALVYKYRQVDFGVYSAES